MMNGQPTEASSCEYSKCPVTQLPLKCEIEQSCFAELKTPGTKERKKSPSALTMRRMFGNIRVKSRMKTWEITAIILQCWFIV
jgi:hypothetical protein